MVGQAGVEDSRQVTGLDSHHESRCTMYEVPREARATTSERLPRRSMRGGGRGSTREGLQPTIIIVAVQGTCEATT